jgi:predicted HTH transcriptional regulator
MKTKALRKIDYLVEKAGVGMVQTLEKYYDNYLKNPNERNAKQYVLWRLRLHRKVKNDRSILDPINEARNLGLYDSNPGETCWNYNFE